MRPPLQTTVDRTGDLSAGQAALQALLPRLAEDHFPLEREQNWRHSLYSTRDGEAATQLLEEEETVERPCPGTCEELSPSPSIHEPIPFYERYALQSVPAFAARLGLRTSARKPRRGVWH